MVAWAVPVAIKFPAFTEPEFKVAMFPTEAKSVEIVDVMAFNIDAARLPVTERFEAVVEPIVEDPEIERFAPPIFPVEVS